MGLEDDLARYIGQKAGAQTVIFGSVKTQGASLRLEIKALDVDRGRVIDRFSRTVARADAEELLAKR
jgi:TolB-like protein